MSANQFIRFVELSSGLIRDYRIPLFLIQILTENLYPAPVTHSSLREIVTIRKLPGYGRTY